MIDQLTVLLPHVLMAIAIWRLLHRDDVDHDPALPRPKLLVKHRRPKPATDAGVRDA